MSTEQLLEKVPLFRHLSAQRLNRIREAGLMEVYEKGSLLFRQGEEASALWAVVSGWVHLLRSASDPSISPPKSGVAIFTVTPKEGLCGVSAIEGDTYSVSGVAGTDCHVFRIPAVVLREILNDEPAFTSALLKLCVRRLRHISEQYGAMAEPVPKRIVRAVLRLRGQFGSSVPVTHRELAQMAWTTTESAIRTVGKLKQRGLLSGSRGQLRILKAGALEELLAQTNGHLS